MTPAHAPDNFEIVTEIGEGAFARVYRARDKSTGKVAALKILKEAFAGDAQVIERLRREMLAVGAIDSAHVVKLHDVGATGGDLFIAMEYVEGPTLRERLHGRPWPAEAARVVVGQVAEALAAAHAQGIVHRDLKPENVMLVGGGQGRKVKVLDFGLAKLVGLEGKRELEPLTQTGMCFGTPQYMAPEQVQGRAAAAAADLWALAVMAYELVSGRLPWDGAEPRDVLRALTTAPVPPLGTLHPTVAGQRAALDQFFAGALAKAPDARLADASAFFGAFETALFGHARTNGAPFSGVVAAELAEAELDALRTTEGPRPAIMDSISVDFETLGSTTLPGKRRLHSMWSLSLSTLPPLSPGTGDDAPLLDAPPVVRKSSRTAAPVVAPAEAPAAAARAETTEQVRRAASIGWILVAAAVLIVVAALGGYFIGRGPR
jgi:serine/threonine-protein kinase